jgi:DNA-binding SARP family transcriptional activator
VSLGVAWSTASCAAAESGGYEAVEWEFSVLGPLEVRRDDCEVPIRSGQQRVVLASLLLRANHVVPLDELIDCLWGESPPRGARNTLRAYVMRLRQTLGLDVASRSAVIVTHSEGYSIQVERERLDLLCFEDLITQSAHAGDAQDPVEESRFLGQALALWRGPVLSNVDSESLHRDVVVGLTERRLQALQRRIDLDLQLGHHDEVIPELQGVIAEYPLRERFSAQLMLALYRSGRQADALETYRRVRNRLDAELGVDPGEDLQELHQAVLAADPGLAPSRTPRTTVSQPSSPPAVFQLPPDIRGFVGRAELVDEIAGLITTNDPQEQTQVVTLSGRAGVGKTALAVHLAHRLTYDFPDGVLFLDLRGYSADPALTAHQAQSQLLRMLGHSLEEIPATAEGQARQYQSLLASKRLLLVLDNVAAPEDVRPLLPAEARSAALVTSRDELRDLTAPHGAHSVPVDALSPEESQGLLADLLGEQKVADEPQAAAELATLCAHLPLALRIAAATITGRLADTLAEHVTELCQGNHLVDDEDTVVQRAFDASYRGLDADTRRLLLLLGLVPGPDFSAGAAAALSGETPETTQHLLDRLSAANLIHEYAAGRYRFHDLLREYAVQYLTVECDADERNLCRRRLFAYYLDTADAATQLVHTDSVGLRILRRNAFDAVIFDDPQDASHWLDVEYTNLAATVRETAEHGPHEIAWQLTDLLRPCLGMWHAPDWIRTTEAALRAAQAEGERTAEAAMLLSLGFAWAATGDSHQAADYRQRSLSTFDQAGVAKSEITAFNNLRSPTLIPAHVMRHEVSEPPSESGTAAHREPTVPGRSRRRTGMQLNTGWLLATILTIYAAVFDSSSAYFLGLLLMGTIIAVSVIALAVSAYQQPIRAFTNPQSRKHLVANSMAMVPLLAVGYPLSELTTDHLGVSAMWLVPAFATSFYATAVIPGLASVGRAGRILTSSTARVVTRSLGAITAGLAIGALALFVERGPEISWSTGESVDGAYAEGTIHRTSRGELQVSGKLLDEEANFQGTRLHIQVQYANDTVKSWNYVNHGGKGTVEPIGGVEGFIVPSDIKFIHVMACAADADKARQVVIDTRCGAPIEIWKR